MIWVFFIIILCFAAVIAFGAPYLPTLKKQQIAALELLDLKPGQTLLELGSGDGRVARLAAKKGLKVVGYELNPLLVLISYFVTWKYRRQVKIIWGNFWLKPWPKSDGAYVFLLDRYMARLDKKIKSSENPPPKLASFTFLVPGKKPAKTKDGVSLYIYNS